MTSVTDSFSYSLDEREIVKRAREIASTMGISFSQYVMQCIKENQQKKEVDPCERSNESIESVSYKPALDTKDVFEITKYVSHIEEPATLRRLMRNSQVMKDVARTHLKKIGN
ncbi:hypothetical protein [Glutamicibacter sp.]|jgi:hypothetical protein|uniref:hypothetical protein n=1 Tax=Glutamicibacter sp. TaxID=1931995 RepID=UPI002B47657F|nr:hypothetical protein [Glutamicibacter sp.]